MLTKHDRHYATKNVNDPIGLKFKQHSFYLRITYSSVLFLKMMMMKTVLFWS